MRSKSSWSLVIATTLVVACGGGSESGETPTDTNGTGGVSSGGGGTPAIAVDPLSLRCGSSGIPAPRDVAASATGSLCLSVSLDKIARLVGQTPEELASLDASVLVGPECLGVDVPSSMQFVVGIALRQDQTGADYAKDFRVPLPSKIDPTDLGLFPGLKLPTAGVTVPEDAALIVAKVTEFRGERYLKIVNIAAVVTEGETQFIQSLTSIANERMSAAMKVDGPGIYGVFLARSEPPIGFVSGKLTQDGKPVAGAVVVGTGAPFLAFSDATGAYTLANVPGQAGIAAFELTLGAHAEKAFPMVVPGTVNPKTGLAFETTAVDSPLPALKNLNLTGVDLALAVDPAPPAADNLGFESDFASWSAKGNASVLETDFAAMFPGSTEKKYAFISSGAGSVGGVASSVIREFAIPRGAKKLKVDYDFVSQEYPSWVNTQFNDMFYIIAQGGTEFIHKETVNDNSGKWLDFYKPLGNVDQSAAETTGVLHVFGGRTGKRTAEYDISACAGETVRLIFAVSDMGDSIYDSAALIDKVSVE